MNSIKVWENTLTNRAEGTQKQYRYYFSDFLRYAGVSPDELREMKFVENQEAKPWERNRVENLLRGYIKTLEKRNLTCSTQSLAYAATRSFFEAQGMPLFLKREDKPIGCAFGSKALIQEEIRQIKNAAELLRDKALIMFLKDSGLRQSDASTLKWKDFKDYGEGFWGFQIQTKKKKVKARGFIGSEAVEILELYKRKRMEGTQKLSPEENIEDNPVFALISEPKKVVRPEVMSGTLGRIISLAGIEKASPHGLRKFWEQNMHVEHVAYQKQMNGRALDSVERSYYWKEAHELFEIYKSNYDNLRIEKQEFKDVAQRLRREYEIEINGLKEENKSLRKLWETEKEEIMYGIEDKLEKMLSKKLFEAGIAQKMTKAGITQNEIKKTTKEETLDYIQPRPDEPNARYAITEKGLKDLLSENPRLSKRQINMLTVMKKHAEAIKAKKES